MLKRTWVPIWPANRTSWNHFPHPKGHGNQSPWILSQDFWGLMATMQYSWLSIGSPSMWCSSPHVWIARQKRSHISSFKMSSHCGVFCGTSFRIRTYASPGFSGWCSLWWWGLSWTSPLPSTGKQRESMACLNNISSITSTPSKTIG